MILNCNSCEKKFVVPDQAITEAGRLVQCSSCGNKWKQFPIKSVNTKTINKRIEAHKVSKKPNPKKKKPREINLYSPEYLEKKHGITLNNKKESKIKHHSTEKITFGFYNYLIVFIAILTLVTGVLANTHEIIINKFPSTEIYIIYFFEAIENIKTIINSLIKFN
jgi:predicted Zn finger-like uncharacterized protein